MTRDRVRWIRPYEAFERDVLAVASRPTVTASFWVDLEPVLELIEAANAATHRRLTLMPFLIKAASVAVLDSPALHRMFGIWRAVDPRQADIGISVAGSELLAPVIVIPAANVKSVLDIDRELQAARTRALADEARATRLFDRFLWLLPLPFLRRLLIRAWLLSPRNRRRIAGTLQISSFRRFDLEFGISPIAIEVLLNVGVIRSRVDIAPNGEAIASRGATFVLQASHMKLNGATAGAFVRRFQQLLAAPVHLLDVAPVHDVEVAV